MPIVDIRENLDSFLAPPGARGGASTGRRRVHAVSFDAPELALAAVKRLRAEGYDVYDVHSPFPIHGMDEALGLRETRLGMATLVGGLAGGVLATTLQIWTHAVDWPLVIGGKSPLALPAQVPVSFELTVLFAALATVAALLVRRRLRPRAGDPPTQPNERVTDDRFVALVVESDASFEPHRFRALCATLGAEAVDDGWRTS